MFVIRDGDYNIIETLTEEMHFHVAQCKLRPTFRVDEHIATVQVCNFTTSQTSESGVRDDGTHTIRIHWCRGNVLVSRSYRYLTWGATHLA